VEETIASKKFLKFPADSKTWHANSTFLFLPFRSCPAPWRHVPLKFQNCPTFANPDLLSRTPTLFFSSIEKTAKNPTHQTKES